MSIARTWPWLRADPARVRDGGWQMVLPETGEQPLGEALETWDPLTPLNLSRMVQVDVDGLRADCQLPEARLRLVVSWHALGTTLRGVGNTVVLPESGELRESMALFLDPGQLGGTLLLRTSISLVERTEKRPLVAHRPGSILWEDEHELRLEGSGSRFPTTVVDFSKSDLGLPSKAAWRLEWDREDFELPVLGGMQLFLNSAHPRIKEMVENPRDPSSELILSMMQFDVARTLVQGALDNEQFLSREEPWPQESVGRVIHRLFNTHFRGQSPEALKRQLEADPDRFVSTLQDRFGFFHRV